ncbi:MAG TPA: NADH-quinone oxidoreductase subunit NuoB [Acidisoma sp.]|uniref:NADH-quinone oxidoreductase subunit B family protein n=1 Tax=Acidisoma sp. TaxID=1872115 RepID=UPI002BC6A379|nr:NADH-quinone oxidoreductase subunit NuoB [Acidisoma sp.]HTI00307.1 NADH-quinone oxidoreductase subunit NuoB [Acidisoma sp.]
MRKTLFDSLIHRPFTEPLPAPEGEIHGLDQAARRRLGRSLAIRVVDAGSCNGCELELNALSNPLYDLERCGLKVVASPRHADVLLVTGPVTGHMEAALRATYEAMPAPKWVIACGDCAGCGGLYAQSPACLGGVSAVLPVNLTIPGCPPTPRALLAGLRRLMEA